jgi:hypothetical protein
VIRPASLGLAALTVAALAATGPAAHAAGSGECSAARVHYMPYPGRAAGLGGLPWVRGSSEGLGLVGLIWYWPPEWRTQQIDRALIYPGGKAPSGVNTKILWAFLSAKAKRMFKGGNLVVRGERLDGVGKTWQQFVSIGYAGQNGAPSYASIITLPSVGCWRLHLGAGGLRASVVFQATSGA